ncbi:MAG TPA: S-methyl-5'-thioinosine phosphorylase [Burkholderiales bacterium]|nr:S-methyl-5'-thioinosine phosphorylase [Burkholderiales bacterium]
MLAILGGSGLSRLATLSDVQRKVVHTPYGEPSGALSFGSIGGRELVFLARHGDDHSIPPHQVNYRANIRALQEAGVKEIVSVATVGGIRREFGPGALVLPDQIIDYTWGRPSTFFEGAGAKVTHIDFTEPYSAALRERILKAAEACGETVAERGVYATTQGPRLETAAEINRLERDGADLVGMTAMPEAALAREAGMEYAAIAVVANHAAGRGDSTHAIPLERIQAVVDQAMNRVRRIIAQLVAASYTP